MVYHISYAPGNNTYAFSLLNYFIVWVVKREGTTFKPEQSRLRIPKVSPGGVCFNLSLGDPELTWQANGRRRGILIAYTQRQKCTTIHRK